MKPLRLNIGCGEEKLHNFINIDSNETLHPDEVLDIRKGLKKYEDNSVEQICLFHIIEHIEKKFHRFILAECSRVLEIGGTFLIAYPEFRTVAQHYIDNHQGNREFWEATIYGRQSTIFDFHVSLMDSNYFIPLLRDVGFYCEVTTENGQEFNTLVLARKVRNIVFDEDILRKEVCENGIRTAVR